MFYFKGNVFSFRREELLNWGEVFIYRIIVKLLERGYRRVLNR